MPMINVTTPSKTYQVQIISGGLNQLGQLVTRVWQPRQVAVITDTNVGPHYADQVQKQLSMAGFTVHVLTVPAGEHSKGWATVQQLIDALSTAHFTRGDGVLALGGGVVGDFAGFVASIYMRGIGLIQVPTSLLSQVDSSVGGKTAIDLLTGKNLVGSFYQPDLVLIDPTTLGTLPRRMLVEGYGEILKCAALVGSTFWDLVQTINTAADILTRAVELIEASVTFKAAVVMADEHEGGRRQLLNFGHTIGHAVELLGQGRYMHGEAVAIGTVQVAKVFAAHGSTPPLVVDQLRKRLRLVGLPTELPDFSITKLVAVMRHDKKVHGDALTFVYLRNVGVPALQPVALADLMEWLAPLQA